MSRGRLCYQPCVLAAVARFHCPLITSGDSCYQGNAFAFNAHNNGHVLGTAVGVFLGDEVVCHGVPFENMTAVARRLRAGLGPSAILAINECGRSYGIPSWPEIPPELDLVSADGCILGQTYNLDLCASWNIGGGGCSILTPFEAVDNRDVCRII